jgi:glycosyltransferase involved in cell wall biosynthesis
MYAVSVIIPIYNVAPFVARCAMSLFEQTFEDIEYIFVDDATQDNSIEILQNIINKYPQRKQHIKIIHHQYNKGPAISRQTGLSNATGEYISMCDSDDYIEADTIERFYGAAKNTNADIAVCDIFMENTCGQIIITDKVASTKDENFLNMLKQEEAQGYLWNKFVRKALFNNTEILLSQNINYLEDWYVTQRLYYFADSIVKVEKPLYHYVCNTDSITKKIKKNNFESAIFFYKTLKEFLEKHKILNKYQSIVREHEVQTKLRLFWGVRSAKLRYEYSNMFLESEKFLWHKLKLSDKAILYFSRHKYATWATMLLRYFVILKQKYKATVKRGGQGL